MVDENGIGVLAMALVMTAICRESVGQETVDDDDDDLEEDTSCKRQQATQFIMGMMTHHPAKQKPLKLCHPAKTVASSSKSFSVSIIERNPHLARQRDTSVSSILSTRLRVWTSLLLSAESINQNRLVMIG